jgi:hypothetical protein
MNSEDQASLMSIQAQMAHLLAMQRRLPAPRLVPAEDRPAAIDAMLEIGVEIRDLAREARRLERKLRGEGASQQP